MLKQLLVSAIAVLLPCWCDAQRPVDDGLVKRYRQEVFASERSSVELLERGHVLIAEGRSSGDCDETALGLTLVAVACSRTPDIAMPSALRSMPLPAGCDPAFPHLHYQLGAALFGYKNFVAAIPHFQRAATFDSFAPTAWNAVGASYENLNQLDSAVVAYERALAATTTGINPLLLNNLASIYLTLNISERARESALQGLEACGDKATWAERGLSAEVPLLLQHNLMVAAIQLKDTATATAAFRFLDDAISNEPSFVQSILYYSLFTESPAARDYCVARIESLTSEEALSEIPEEYRLLHPLFFDDSFQEHGSFQAAWFYLVAAKRLNLLQHFHSYREEPADSAGFAMRNLRHWGPWLMALEGILLTLLLVLFLKWFRTRQLEKISFEESGDALEPASRDADLDELHRQIASGTVQVDWIARWNRTLTPTGPTPAAEFKETHTLNDLEFNVLEMSARGLDAKSIAQALDRTPGYILNRRSILRQRLDIARDVSFSDWWQQNGPRALGIVLLAACALKAEAAELDVWQAALATQDTAGIQLQASTWAGSPQAASPGLIEIGLYTESMLYAPDFETWEQLRPAFETEILRDTASASDLLGPLKWVYAPWRGLLERETDAVAGTVHAELSPKGWWSLVGPWARRDEMLASALLARLPAPAELQSWWGYAELRKLAFHLGIVVILASLALLLLLRERNVPKDAEPALSGSIRGSAYLPLLLAAARAKKPMAMQFALWEACAFESGRSALLDSPYLPEAWHRLNLKEKLLLHLLHARVSSSDCAHVLGCSERYLYAMRSAVRKKLGLEGSVRLEQELARWTRQG